MIGLIILFILYIISLSVFFILSYKESLIYKDRSIIRVLKSIPWWGYCPLVNSFACLVLIGLILVDYFDNKK